MQFISEDQPIEYLEVDSSYFQNQEQSSSQCDEVTPNIHHPEDTPNFWSQYDVLDNTVEVEQIHQTPIDAEQQDICKNCLVLEVELQKSKMVIAKLQKRCADKTAEINRLRLSEKRAKLAKKTLEDLLKDIKNKNWISDEGRDVLNVIEPNICHQFI